MRTRTLALPLTLAREGPPAVRLPVLPVVPRLGNVTAHPVRALVDTGAHAVLATMKLARRLGLDPARLRESPHRPVWQDPDGLPLASYGAFVHLTLGDPHAGDVIALGETLVYFTDAPFGPYPLRLGQVGFLDRVTFTQYGDAQFALDRAD